MFALLPFACGDANGTADASLADDAADGDAAIPDAGVPDAEIPDAAPPDARVCRALVAPEAGAPCSIDSDCGLGGLCLNGEDGWPDTGYCSRTCIFDSNCGARGFCSDDIGGGGRICLARCCGDEACGETGNSCQDALIGFIPLGGLACLPADETAGDGAACAEFADCASFSFCQVDPFEAPGGYCLTVGCTVGDDSTCAAAGDGTCIDFGDGGQPLCVDTCTVPSDCRESEGYDCVDVGPPFGKLCFYNHAAPGSACTVDSDCADPPWECLTGGGGAFPGGYCGADGCDPADETTCPDETVCYDDDPGTLDGTEYCAALCDPAAIPADCREGEGYACTDLGGGVFGCIVP